MMGIEGSEQLAHVIIDYLNVWKPGDYEDGHIPYSLIEREIVELLRGFTTLKVLTLDQYGAFATVDRLREALREFCFDVRVLEENFNVRSNYIRAERFKAGAGEGWIHAYRDTLVETGAVCSRES